MDSLGARFADEDGAIVVQGDVDGVAEADAGEVQGLSRPQSRDLVPHAERDFSPREVQFFNRSGEDFAACRCRLFLHDRLAADISVREI